MFEAVDIPCTCLALGVELPEDNSGVICLWLEGDRGGRLEIGLGGTKVKDSRIENPPLLATLPASLVLRLSPGPGRPDASARARASASACACCACITLSSSWRRGADMGLTSFALVKRFCERAELLLALLSKRTSVALPISAAMNDPAAVAVLSGRGVSAAESVKCA